MCDASHQNAAPPDCAASRLIRPTILIIECIAQTGAMIVLLLCGGDKDSQDADIERAAGYWKDWQRRLK
jgi:hypothetical protein